MRLPALSLVLAALLGPSALFAQNPASAAAGTTLEPGDTIRIIVWRKPEFSGDFVIGQDGTITHPLYRAIKVGGVPIPQAEDDHPAVPEPIRSEPAVRHGAADQCVGLRTGAAPVGVRRAAQDEHRRGGGASRWPYGRGESDAREDLPR